MKFLQSIWFPVILGICIIWVIVNEISSSQSSSWEGNRPRALIPKPAKPSWAPPDINQLPDDSAARLIKYGKELVINTARYFGPRGSISFISNGMTCQNCHVDAGLRPFGNCFSSVASTYPKFRDRSGKIESVEWRINECFERSLNGKKLDSGAKEMQAMVSYIKWVGTGVPKGEKPVGAGLREMEFIRRAADPLMGKEVYVEQCQRCHGINGEGQLSFDSVSYTYPPLWGKHSYNVSAGLYRLSKLAAYVKDNMPFGTATYLNPQLSDEQAWDVAAFINSQERPYKFFRYDWPRTESKPVDFPFGPYTDTFTERQHKYGPFEPIKNAKASKVKMKAAGF